MDLLFNKANDEASAQAELKLSLGFIDADLKFSKMKPDIRTATSRIIETIGKTTYDSIVAHYKADPVTEPDLVELAQYAVATAAYRLYAPANDLQHGNNGRKMLTSEQSKTPFEHMIVADNDELERRSFRALDDLIKQMDDSYAVWKSSAEYKTSYKLFVRNTTEFDNHYILNSRLLYLKLEKGLQLAEKREIYPRLGKDVFDIIKAKRNGTNSTALTPVEKELLDLSQEACVYSALSWGIVRLQATLFPEGVLQSVRSDRTTIKGRSAFIGNQIDQLSQLFSTDSARVLKEIEDVMQSQEPIVPEDEIIVNPDDPFGSNENDPFVTT